MHIHFWYSVQERRQSFEHIYFIITSLYLINELYLINNFFIRFWLENHLWNYSFRSSTPKMKVDTDWGTKLGIGIDQKIYMMY